jgi:hypothetical protein
MKIKVYKNDWTVTFEKIGYFYAVLVRNANGDVYDKMRCDDYSRARDYWKAFNAIAKAAR